MDKKSPDRSFSPPDLPASYRLRWWNFSKEIWNDHDFWIRALAVKAGASAIVVAGIIGISRALALHPVAAALAISACTGLVCFGLYGVIVGAASANDKLGDIYARTVSGEHRPLRLPSIRRLHMAIAHHPRLEHFIERPWVRRFRASKPWIFIRRQIRKEQNVFLASLAGTGSAIWGVFSALALAAVLPALAIGSLFTFSTVAAIGGLMSGIYGVYLSAHSLIDHFRKKKAPTAGTTAADDKKDDAARDNRAA